MNRFLRHSILFFILLAGNLVSAYAQQFQWVKGGGTNQSSANLNTNPEGVYYMCTDPNGNVYTLSIVGQNAIFADTFYRGSAYGVDINMFVASYNCSGQMRWAKLIGSSAGGCYPFGIVADSVGHIYLAGTLRNGTLHIGYDTAITGHIYDNLGVIQFDTSGHFNWIRYVGNNTPLSFSATGTSIASLSIDSASNVHFIPWIKSGAVLSSSVTSHYGNYDLKYNSSGILLSAKRLQMDSSILVTGTTIDKKNNTLYAFGYRNPLFIDSSAYNFLAAFDTNGNRLWVDTLGMNPSFVSTGNFSGITADGFGHLYVCGAGFSYLIYQGDTIRPNAGAYISFVMKTDTLGNKQWLTQGNGNGGLTAITMMSGNKVAAAGHFYVKFKSGYDSIINTTPGTDPFIFIVDSSGLLLDLKGVHGNGYSDYTYSVATDKLGNIYIGGAVADTIPSTAIPAYHSLGGNTDFFVLKYGLPCNCTSSPVASFTTSGSNAVNFTYTGTIAGLDSVVWHFGDGVTGTGLSTTHAYAISDTFRICEYTYAYCGVDSTCGDIVVIGVGVNGPNSSSSTITVYPNPATNELNISGVISLTDYRLISITGSVLNNGVLQKGKNSISMKEYPSGVYVIELKGDDVSKTTMRVIKE